MLRRMFDIADADDVAIVAAAAAVFHETETSDRTTADRGTS